MRTAAEIDAAKVLNTTDLGAITSEVRQFPPGYVTGGRLKLNTNLQIEVAPIAINIAGKDVRIAETVIIGNEHWVIDGVETPRVPGSWYYLYLSTAAQFAVSPNAPAYNNLYFAYYHPEIQDLRAIGKFYFGDDGTVLYVQTSLETASAQVIVAPADYAGQEANYYISGDAAPITIAASKYLNEVYTGGLVQYTDGIFWFDTPTVTGWGSNVSFRGNGRTIWDSSCSSIIYLEDSAEGVVWENIVFRNVGLIVFNRTAAVAALGNRVQIRTNRFEEDSFIGIYAPHTIIEQNTFNTLTLGIALSDESSRSIVRNNHFLNVGRAVAGHDRIDPAVFLSALHISSGTSSFIFNNIAINCGNLIDGSPCDNSSTSPMIFGEAAPTASNCTWGFTATGPYEGVGCYRFTKTAAAGTISYLHLVDNVGAADVHGLIPGTQYEWGGWLKVAASASCGFQGFRVYQATTGAGAASAVAWTTATTGWQEVRVTATVYVNATTAYIGLVASASLGAMSFDVDNLRLFPPGTTNVHNQNYYDGGGNTYDGL